MVMRSVRPAVLAAAVGALAACASPQEKAAKAHEESAKADLETRNERLKLLDEYKACVADADEDRGKLEACDQTLKAIDAPR